MSNHSLSPSRSPTFPSHRSLHSRHRNRRQSRRWHQDQERPRKRHRPTFERETAIPFGAPQLSRHDLDVYRPLFASYLDIQKQKHIEELDATEVKGRWKSFYRKWNEGELAAGWYDPKLKLRIDADWVVARPQPAPANEHVTDSGQPYSDPDSETGPAPLSFTHIASHDQSCADTTASHRDDRRALYEELVPRAEAGTRERMLEKKRNAATANKAYREGGRGDGEMEVGDGDLMGSGGVDEARVTARIEQRKRTERELRRDEISQARKVEREERMQGYREKEARTMDVFKSLARERFGAGASSD